MDVNVKKFVDAVWILTAEELVGSLMKDFKIKSKQFRFEGKNIDFSEVLKELLIRSERIRWR